ncbi:MAG: hypothetical protein U1C48_05280 [Methylotenera sp.]|nr:hypothetical protein [Methylotenera sp.]
MIPLSNSPPKHLQISPIKVASTLAIIWSVIVFYGTLCQVTHLYFNVYLPGTELTYLDSEMNIPAIFSGFMLLLSSMIIGFIWYLEKNLKNGKYWLILSGGFFFMFLEEVFEIHEKITAPIQEMIGHDHLGFFKYSWIIPYAIISLIVGLYFLKFLFSLPKKTTKRFLIAGIWYVVAALGIEGITGISADYFGNTDNFAYLISMTIEEASEMYAISFFIFALLKYIQQAHPGTSVSFEASQVP